MIRVFLKYAIYFLVLGLMFVKAEALTDSPHMGRFFFMGDGWLNIANEKKGESFSGRFRLNKATYDPTAIADIYRVFNAPYDPATENLSLRLIEFLDYLEDHLSPGARITIVSGYRSPTYNTGLRNQGRLAAKASLHQYGMATDLKMEGVPARRIWEYVKSLGFGGAGYYHGETVHVDVGPARSWDEKTSGVGTGISRENKLIGVVTDRDIYRPREVMILRFIRMTAFPIGVVPEFRLVCQTLSDNTQVDFKFKPLFTASIEGPCPKFNDINQMTSFRWKLPLALPAGRYRVLTEFCDCPWEEMPLEIATPEFEIIQPLKESPI